jgi:hypothetical protein
MKAFLLAVAVAAAVWMSVSASSTAKVEQGALQCTRANCPEVLPVTHRDRDNGRHGVPRRICRDFSPWAQEVRGSNPRAPSNFLLVFG